jgi:hypothetical protein
MTQPSRFDLRSFKKTVNSGIDYYRFSKESAKEIISAFDDRDSLRKENDRLAAELDRMVGEWMKAKDEANTLRGELQRVRDERVSDGPKAFMEIAVTGAGGLV